MKKPRVYIAGPMRGLPFYNFPAFDKACSELNQQGFWAVSPADLDRTLYGMDPWELPEGHNWHEHPAWMPDEEEVLRTDINVLRTCDAVLFLTGWQNSEGAKREREAAFEHGIGVYDNMDDLVLGLKPLQPVVAGSKATNPKDLIGSDKLTPHVKRLKEHHKDRNPKHYTIDDNNPGS